jgi:hypothetical protein
MADVLDLSKLTEKSVEPKLDELSDEEQQALARMAEENPPETPSAPVAQADTAFVVVTINGSVQVGTLDMAGQVTVSRQPTNDDVYGMCATVLKDVLLREGGNFTAQTTVDLQLKHAAAMQQQMETQAVQRQLQQTGLMKR